MSSKQAKQEKKLVTSNDVFLYIPNLIGYSRVVTAVLSFMAMPNHPMYTALIYTVSCLLDALDGTMARKYNQCSKFGAVLDMITDRSTTSSLLCFLSILYPKYCIIFQILLSLDLSSHYIHMYSTLIDAKNETKSHKSIDENSNYFLKLYYSNRTVLFMICAFNEIVYGGIYLIGFQKYAKVGYFLFYISLPGFLFKQFTNILQLQRASIILASIDADDANKANKY
ncbi:hypothetical protein TPHA_0D03985 [Tetrapisispora phaffii CBS 4417]|uniref:CDP-diacylglycerol--inositol 3-phosphatidyltransferase n=1 Tax=Tetrapisispora phaffii (strain ATCC 24235 / CBS 4417 / NBRC 1672 / NRRL Y-8282 / UCD 70-5) TaxID=1071381 RepID=G8BT61_TETPH|nr:hypothetical protein TPHA_0D03985 [Tetrapisispora phaffii CBS 4417]CCE63032.1 hypothetical protein TPHA_0D03985 [Tetrapisispora phaffii CBS 4417]